MLAMIPTVAMILIEGIYTFHSLRTSLELLTVPK